MLLHLGQDVSVFAKDVVMIMDAQRAEELSKTREYVEKARESGNYFHLCEGDPKSYVLVERKGEGSVLYTSSISAATLLKRCIRTAKRY